MRCGEEGKLLARAAGFFITLRKRSRLQEPTYFALNFSCHAKEMLHIVRRF
jgi:hypothetical protein